MLRKLTVISLVVGLCLMGVIPGLAQKVYPTLAEYEKITGKSIEKFNEAPSLKTRVAAGEIPPVEERLPEEPMVVEPLEEIGRYGGTYRGASIGPDTWAAGDINTLRGQNLFRLLPDLKTFAPNIAKGWDRSKDLKRLTVYLRRGMKWSDGEPFTAEDIIFWYNGIILDNELTPVKPKKWSPGGELMKAEKINDYTVCFEFAAPYPIAVGLLVLQSPYCPKHFLKKYHVKYNAKANKIAKKEGYDQWWECFNYHRATGTQEQQDIDCPTLSPWMLKKTTTTQLTWERNPYYWKIDIAGNQLPYIDEQKKTIFENPEVVNLKSIAGEFDLAAQSMKLENYPLYKEGEKKGNYRTLLWKKPWGTELEYFFNFTYNKDPILRKIFNDIRWRQAMSLAINRKEISDILFFGKAIPRQATAPSDTTFYEDWMGEYYTEYDPKKANSLLDEMGLKWDKKHQYRLRPDGDILQITINYCHAEGPRGKICELVKEYWEKVGVKVAVKELDKSLYLTRARANEMQVGCWQMGGATELSMRLITCRNYRPPWHGLGSGTTMGWWNWYATDGKSGEEPPEVIKKLFKICDEWLTTVPGTAEYMKLGKEILTINVKNLFVIGTVGETPWPILVKNNLRNIPNEGTFEYQYGMFGPYQGDQWFFKK